MKNVRVKVVHYTYVTEFGFAIFEGKKALFVRPTWVMWKTEEAAIRNAKAMAKRIGIKFDPEIIKQHGC